MEDVSFNSEESTIRMSRLTEERGSEKIPESSVRSEPQHLLETGRLDRRQKVQRCIVLVLSLVAVAISVIGIIVVEYLPKKDFAHEEDLTALSKKIAMASAKAAFWKQYKSLKRSRQESKWRFKHSPVSAHKSLAFPPRIPGSENKQDPFFKKDYNVCVRINTSQSPTEHARGVEVDTQGLVIRHAGLYFVYSSVNFKPNSTDFSSNFAYQTWFQYIYKLRPNSPAYSTVLTRVVHTCCLNCTNSQETSFSGGTFNLEVNDMIQVCLTGQGLISFDASSTFLGLFMLRSANKHN